MEYVLTAQEMANADHYTREVIGIPSLVLMERASLGVAEEIVKDFPCPGHHVRIAVLAGKGNNGADAIATGRILREQGYDVKVFLVGGRNSTSEQDIDTPLNRQVQILSFYGTKAEPFSEEDVLCFRPDVVIDGLFGTGLSRTIKDPYASAVNAINQAKNEWGSRIYSVDIPSGIDGTTGQVMGCAVQADVTVTFAFYKRGHFLYPGCEYCGKVVLKDIGITQKSLSSEPEMMTYRTETCEQLLPRRKPDANKGTFGKVLLIAGSQNVCGACILSAEAILRMGAGMIKVFTHSHNFPVLEEALPEAMYCLYEDENTTENDVEMLNDALNWADVVAIGPGIGFYPRSKDMLNHVLCYASSSEQRRKERGKKKLGLVIDADAIRLIAEENQYEDLKQAGEHAEVILTPHISEASELLKKDINDLKMHRIELGKKFAREYSCTLVLKDARTMVVSHDSSRVYLNTSGNNGLSKAGSGDVLTGIVASCLAQGMHAFDAGCVSTYIHGRAAEVKSKDMKCRSITASDIIQALSSDSL